MRVMLDTNILVSAFVFRSGKIYSVINHIISHNELVLSSYVVDELRDVITRKFPKQLCELDVFLTSLSFTLVHTPRKLPPNMPKIRDIFDAPILYTAIIDDIDVLITGDKDFHDVDVKKPAIMTITGFENEYVLP